MAAAAAAAATCGEGAVQAGASANLRRPILKVFKQFVYASRDLPNQDLARSLVWRQKAWLRRNPWDARCFAYLQYQRKEVEATIKLAKYRTLKQRYYS
eukprot:TRINITY_DN65067_c0_g1_i1.p1 TRINITY_DN65067_c0_g1~~TRINITY_DN65067_c0_g1_i1.p1  ORF type:complete len:113 (-),score=20.93 TRINITY_DN65067_c0_g1_i1:281-574(-)